MSDKGISPLTKSLYISTAAIVAQNQRVLVLSQNIANAEVKAMPGQEVYRRQLVSFHNVYDKKIKAPLLQVKKIIHVKADPIKSYSPGDPMADKEGFVQQPNIKPIEEMTDVREASRSHESNLRAFERILLMLQNTVGLLKG
ncbi:MAG: flagellar basal body rod C-terminal domain-containing protein [Pseudomonadota bacterium]